MSSSFGPVIGGVPVVPLAGLGGVPVVVIRVLLLRPPITPGGVPVVSRLSLFACGGVPMAFGCGPCPASVSCSLPSVWPRWCRSLRPVSRFCFGTLLGPGGVPTCGSCPSVLALCLALMVIRLAAVVLLLLRLLVWARWSLGCGPAGASACLMVS